MKPKERLLRSARVALKNAYVPYSRFRVGAAILTRDGRIYSGCNIENASYGLTLCAERTAVFKAVSEGETEFRMIAVVVNDPKIAMPCGACLQVLAEFAPDITIILGNKQGQTMVRKLKALLPKPFKSRKLKRK